MVHSENGSRISSVESYEQVTYAAVDLYNSGELAEAIARLREMARVNPNNLKVHEVLAEAYLKTGEVDLAEQEIQTIRDIVSREGLGVKLAPLRTFDELAREAASARDLEARYRELLESNSSTEMVANSGAATQLGVKLMAAGRYDVAERVLVRYGERLRALREGAVSRN